MFALPFEDDCFDVATSFNGIWKGCEDALREARRVVRPGGLVGFSFWGSPKRLGLLPFFAALLELSPPGHVDATLNQGDTGRPGVAEQMRPTPAWSSLTGEQRICCARAPSCSMEIRQPPSPCCGPRQRGPIPEVAGGDRCG